MIPDPILRLVLLTLKLGQLYAQSIANLRPQRQPRSSPADEVIAALTREVEQLRAERDWLLSKLKRRHKRVQTSLKDRFFIIRHLIRFKIPFRRVADHFPVSISSVKRWVHWAKFSWMDRLAGRGRKSVSQDIAGIVWSLKSSNPSWGRHRIALSLWLMGTFIAPSTVRNILKRRRPKPQKTGPIRTSRTIPAKYPLHVIGMDFTTLRSLLFFEFHILVVVDFFSRKILSIGVRHKPWDAAATIDHTRTLFKKIGRPRHCITDQGSVFTSDDFRRFLPRRGIRPRYGRVGQKGSIAVVERVNLSLKSEFLRHFMFFDAASFQKRCSEYARYYNEHRSHEHWPGMTPEMVFNGVKRPPLHRKRRRVPKKIVRASFGDGLIVTFSNATRAA